VYIGEFCKFNLNCGKLIINLLSNDKEFEREGFKSAIVYTTYKKCLNLYKIKQIVRANDSFDNFLKKGKINTNIVAELNKGCQDIMLLKQMYFPNIGDTTSLTVKDIFNKLNTQSSSINFFKALADNENIIVNYRADYFLLVKFIQFSITSDYRYIHNKTLTVVAKKKSPQIPNILPIEHTAQFCMNIKELDMLKKLPSILHQLEWSVLPIEFTSMYKLRLDTGLDELSHFRSALTYPSCQVGYDYEKLETLGDSSIKFVMSYILYYKYNEYKEGQLELKRAGLINNNRLYGLAYKGEVYKFIHSKASILKEWTIPFKSRILLTETKVTKKSLADVLEAIIGACALTKESFYNILRMMDKFNIVSREYGENCFDAIYNKCRMTSSIYYISRNDLEINLPEIIKLTDLVPFKYIKSKAGSHNLSITKNIELIEKLISYSFKDTKLLVTAFTHSSKRTTNNYERLEFLGDAILEYFIVFNLYNIHKDNLGESNITSCNITRAKSSLASNKLLIKISLLLGLHRFINSNNTASIQDYVDTFDPDQLFNEYQEDVINRPKAVSDIFEALIGAIFIDSGIEYCFTFLNVVFRKLIIYTAKYLENIKFSVVDDFVEKCTALYGKKPIFESQYLDGMYHVSTKLNEEIMSTGKAHSQDGAKEIAANNSLKNLTAEFCELI
jgi:dsRNA-specific ribonuclease